MRSLYGYTPAGRTTRCLCIVFTLTITILLYSLFRMSVVSTRRLELYSTQRKPPRPQWEDFKFLQRYYGGLRSLVPRSQNIPEYPRVEGNAEPSSRSGTIQRPPTTQSEATTRSAPFNPYPDYSSSAYLSEYAPAKDCFTELGLNQKIPAVQVYAGVPRGFPDAVMGSSDVLGLRDDVCYDRFGRLGPYGLGYGMRNGGTGAGLHGDREGIEDVWAETGQFDFRGIKWADLQQRCLAANLHRFEARDEGSHHARLKSRTVDVKVDDNEASEADGERPSDKATPLSPARPINSSDASTGTLGAKLLSRTAFVIRTWSTFRYTQEDVLFLRAIISELSLASRGEYTVHLLIHVRDDNLQIWANEELYQHVLHESLPEEFWGLGTLWTERQMGLIYGGLQESFFRGLPVHGVYRSSFMPMQWFAHQHPEYDHFWHWEMDARYTGHYYHLLDKIGSWAKQQPRKGLWERNGRFYVPSVHGSWEDFKQMVRVQTEMGTNNPNNIWSAIKPDHDHGSSGSTRTTTTPHGDKPIWGPEKAFEDAADSSNTAYDKVPPSSYDQDKYEWGVDEDADLITLNPIFDPDGTTWILADDVTGYDRSPNSGGFPPRRASIVTTARLSRRLLHAMHDETAMKRRSMFSEMWPASCALHHGLKAVYAPHPVFIDRAWPTTAYLAATFNGGRNGATGGARTSVFGDRQHNFNGTTFYYNAEFAGSLWRRWLGLKVNRQGGEEIERLGADGRMCLPGILLHPIKRVRLIIEGSMGNGP